MYNYRLKYTISKRSYNLLVVNNVFLPVWSLPGYCDRALRVCDQAIWTTAFSPGMDHFWADMRSLCMSGTKVGSVMTGNLETSAGDKFVL